MGSDRNNPMLNQWLVFLFVGSGMFLSTSGVSIANVALPFITDSFQSDIPSAQWILLGYLLATASTLINFGRLGDLLGQLRVHTVGFAVFALFSLLCAFSNSVEMLVTFRVLQAVGGAMIISNGPGIITSAFPPEQRGRAIGIQATLVGNRTLHWSNTRWIFNRTVWLEIDFSSQYPRWHFRDGIEPLHQGLATRTSQDQPIRPGVHGSNQFRRNHDGEWAETSNSTCPAHFCSSSPLHYLYSAQTGPDSWNGLPPLYWFRWDCLLSPQSPLS